MQVYGKVIAHRPLRSHFHLHMRTASVAECSLGDQMKPINRCND